jgi:hypothetical protein
MTHRIIVLLSKITVMIFLKLLFASPEIWIFQRTRDEMSHQPAGLYKDNAS